MTLSPTDLAAIRERANNATEGPWAAEPDRDYGYYVSTDWSHSQDGLEPELIADLVPHADAVFIAAARVDIPALLDHVDALQARADRHGPCHCNKNPETTDGPEEDCPQHGRPYSHWVNGVDTLAARLSAVRKLVNNPQTVGWIERDGVTAWVSADAIRAALDGPPPPDPHVPYLDSN